MGYLKLIVTVLITIGLMCGTATAESISSKGNTKVQPFSDQGQAAFINPAYEHFMTETDLFSRLNREMRGLQGRPSQPRWCCAISNGILNNG